MVGFTRVELEDAVALVAGVAAVAGSYAVVGPAPAFVVSPLEGSLSRAMPGEVVAFAITYLGDLGQQLNLLAAAALFAVTVGLLARAAIRLGAWANNRVAGPLVTAAGTWLLSVYLIGDLALAGAAALPAGAVVGVAALLQSLAPLGTQAPLSTPRRRVLATLGSGLGIGVFGYALGRGRAPDGTDTPPLDAPNVDREAVLTALHEAKTRELSYGAVDPLVSEDFYQVSIDAVDPDVDLDAWSLSLTGAVEEEVEFGYDELLEMPAENRFVTLRCVGEALNGTKMDTALWSGVPARELLDRVETTGDCECVMLHGEDGYYVQIPIEAMADGLFAYGMNGNVLPRGNGYPLRLLAPGHWGEANTKWLTEIEFLDEAVDGYWEERGWNGTGPVVPVAKLHTVDDRPDGTRLLGGHAYAGVRGVDRVEVSTDGGDTWTEAELSEDLRFDDAAIGAAEGPHDAARQWAYTYDPPSASHEAVVRLVDGNGDVQPRERREPFPDGSSGWVRQELDGS